MIQLSPPLINTQIPAFYNNNLIIPYSFGSGVGINSVKGFYLQLKQVNTNRVIGTTYSYNFNDKYVNFILPDDIFNQLLPGKYYKAQIAYIDQNDTVGLYSGVANIKFTKEPKVEISNLILQSTNLNPVSFVGKYTNEDYSENVQMYKFQIFKEDGQLFFDTDWKIHNKSNDIILTESIDTLSLGNKLKENEIYNITYGIKTNNLLEKFSQKYQITEANLINSSLKCKVTVENDKEEGTIKVFIEDMEDYITGNFVLLRTSSKDDFQSWNILNRFNIINQKYKKQQIYNDFLIEEGVVYKYAIQQFNSSNIYSNKIVSSDITGFMEYSFLVSADGKQLGIKLNPQFNQFKPTLQESKYETIGSKYPFFYRNGIVDYKSFSISGLISQYMDKNNLFNDIYNEENFTTNLTDDNIALEKEFKNQVIDFLNDGKVKFLKTPTEGSYLVRLMNIQTSPENTLGRMLHNFSSEAYEIAEVNNDNLIKFGFLKSNDMLEYIKEEDYFQESIELKDKNFNENLLNKTVNNFCVIDLPFGSKIKINNEEIQIGQTGAYYCPIDYEVNNFEIISLNENILESFSPTISYGFYKDVIDEFDRVEKIELETKLGEQFFGAADIVSHYNITNAQKSIQINKIIYAKIYKKEEEQEDINLNYFANIDEQQILIEEPLFLKNFNPQSFTIGDGLVAEIGVSLTISTYRQE